MLENEFTVPAPVDQAWAVLLDLERVAPCLPGARLEPGDGREFAGTMAIKLGPVTSRYAGTVRVEEADEAARRAVMRAEARDARGSGTAAATITTAMRPVADGTRVTVRTDIQVSGPAAQFGRGVMQEVSGKLMGRFADCLAEEMQADGGGEAPVSMGSDEATPAEAAAGPDSTEGATPDVVDWAAAAVASVPSRPGGYDETRVGRLPTGPAGDAALAAAARRRGEGPSGGAAVRRDTARRPRERRTEEVLDLGAASRAAVLKRVLPALAAIVAVILAVLFARSRSRR